MLKAVCFHLLLCALFFIPAVLVAQDTAQQRVTGRRNLPIQQQKPYLILISADGFRYDYISKYGAQNLQQLAAEGVMAESMKPSFPSVTFPNHYSVATGMYPSHHGIVYNQFYDRNKQATYNMADRKAVEQGGWYGGTPLWVLAEQQGMVTASYHFVGTEAPVQGIYPTYWYVFSNKIDIDRRIATVGNWLRLPEAERPHLITFYMSNTDDAGHHFGPDAPQTRDAVQFVDAAIGKLVDEVKKTGLPVNFIFLADHGMAAVDTVFRLDPSATIDTATFILRGGGTSLHVYAKAKKDIRPLYKKLKAAAVDYDVYLRDKIPAAWHYATQDDTLGRIGDLFLVPHYPKVFSRPGSMISPGAHGFDPVIKDMHATFCAWGPAFRKGIRIPTFENVNVYPLVCRILGLSYTHAIDGKIEVLAPVLQ